MGVWIDKGFKHADRIFIPIFSQKDDFLVQFAQKWINNSGAQVTLIDAAGQVKSRPEIKEAIRAIEHVAPHHIQLRNQDYINKEFLKTQDLMVISFKSWKKLIESNSAWLEDVPSVLILAEKKAEKAKVAEAKE